MRIDIYQEQETVVGRNWAYDHERKRQPIFNGLLHDKPIWINMPDGARDFSIANLWSGNTFHWFYDVVVDYFLLRDFAGAKQDSVFYIAYDSPKYRWARETLGLIGLTNTNEISQGDYEADSHAARTIRVVLPQRRCGRAMDWAVRLLREFFLPQTIPERQGRNVFIVRDQGRNIENQEDVMAALKEIGLPCEVAVFDSMSILDQVRLMQEAKFVIGTHGSGLTNWTFCNPGTRVIEIMSPIFKNGSYHEIAHHCQLSYSCIIGRERHGNKDLYTHSIYVDPELLRWVINCDVPE